MRCPRIKSGASVNVIVRAGLLLLCGPASVADCFECPSALLRGEVYGSDVQRSGPRRQAGYSRQQAKSGRDRTRGVMMKQMLKPLALKIPGESTNCIFEEI